MSNKLNGLTLNQAELLKTALVYLEDMTIVPKDREDIAYLLNQLDGIIEYHNEVRES